MPEKGHGQIGFEQIGVASVLKRYRLFVPPNQREYSWTTEEITKLLNDFAKAISEEGQEHFLGTIVTIPRSNDVLEVVDGQQRLATTAIFLAEIRDYLNDKDPLIAQDIENGFLAVIDRDKRALVPKLQLNVHDNEFFRAWIEPGGKKNRPAPKPKTSHDLIANAFQETAKQVKAIVSPHDVKNHGDVLNRWITFIEHGAQLILLKVPTNKNAYKMFETLNDRGLRTSQADLIKNYLFGQSDTRLAEAQQEWTLMRGSLESLEEEEIVLNFLRHALIVVRGYLTAAEIYEAVQAKAKGPQTAIDLLTTFEKLAATYVAILNSDSEKWNTYPDAMRRAIQTLDHFNLKVFRPLMLAVATRFSPNECAEACQMLISWGVRLLIASSTRSESIIEPFANAAHAVYMSKITTAKALQKQLSDIIPVDAQFRQAFEIATVSKASLARYYLRSLEMAAKNEATPWFIPNDDRQVINLEHVLPEKPEGNWPNFDEEKVRSYSKRIGNMTLLLAKSNSDLRSSDFAMKKEVYKDSPYELTRQIAGESDWNEEQIAARQRVLAELAVKAWPL
jgi:hypothetical protein